MLPRKMADPAHAAPSNVWHSICSSPRASASHSSTVRPPSHPFNAVRAHGQSLHGLVCWLVAGTLLHGLVGSLCHSQKSASFLLALSAI